MCVCVCACVREKAGQGRQTGQAPPPMPLPHSNALTFVVDKLDDLEGVFASDGEDEDVPMHAEAVARVEHGHFILPRRVADGDVDVLAAEHDALVERVLDGRQVRVDEVPVNVLDHRSRLADAAVAQDRDVSEG